MFKNPTRFLARALVLMWAAFWVYFVLAATWGEPGTVGQKALITLIGVSLFAGSALAAWRKEKADGLLLTLEGVALCVVNFACLKNPPATQIFLFVTLALPPLTSGILLLAARPRCGLQPG